MTNGGFSVPLKLRVFSRHNNEYAELVVTSIDQFTSNQKFDLGKNFNEKKTEDACVFPVNNRVYKNSINPDGLPGKKLGGDWSIDSQWSVVLDSAFTGIPTASQTSNQCKICIINDNLPMYFVHDTQMQNRNWLIIISTIS